MKRKYVQAMRAAMALTLSVSLPATTVLAAAAEKEQTVYVTADENGSTEKVIVSSWLKNGSKDSSLTDNSDLQNIENVKGDESFSKNSDGSITWAAGGNDIYYQGETNASLPVSVKITYYLDGKQIQPDALAGKSGKVKIRIDYQNHSQQKVKVGDTEEIIATPFMMATGMILPGDKFSNVEVKNGKVVSDGKNDIVMGIGFPGLADSLQLDDIDDLKDKEIPDYVEITADVEDFSLALTATVATTGTLNDLGLDEIGSMDDLKESIDELTDASTKLVDGSDELREGLETLDSSAATFKDGLDSADAGAGKLKDGIDTMNSKKGDLLDGVSQLVDGMKTLKKGAGDLQSGVKSYTDGTTQLQKGINQVDSGAGSLKNGIDTLNNKKGELTKGIKDLADGGKKLQTGASSLQSGVKSYTDGAAVLQQSITALNDKLSQSLGQAAGLPDAVKALTTGAETLISGADDLKSGAEKASQAAGSLGSTVGSFSTVLDTATGALSDAINAINTSASSDNTKAINNAATEQAKSAVKKENQAVNNAANKQQKSNVKAALKAAGISDEDAQKVLNNLGKIDVNVQTDASVDVSSKAKSNAPDTAALDQAKATLTAVKSELGKSQSEINTISSNILKLKDGADQAAKGAGSLKTNLSGLGKAAAPLSDFSGIAAELQNAVGQLKAGSDKLCGNSAALNAGTKAVVDGAASLNAGLTTLSKGAGALSDGIGQLADGAKALKSGTAKLKSGAKELVSNNKALTNGTKQLADGSKTLLEGGSTLKSGADTLGDGIGKLADGAGSLKGGTAKLADGGEDLKEGTGKLLDGSTELADGMKEFDEDGIQELATLVNVDLQDLLDRFEAVTDADKAYTAFDGANPDGSGSVKFIIETAAIETED
ncbi:MAG: hypothetical protein HFI88_11580 [Lachnospiraceae bacterium]|nr:hypothetical protein [Lachnospiraceae bacterium]